jgi:TRAP-type uncharacterized transport system fused permease subunit
MRYPDGDSPVLFTPEADRLLHEESQRLHNELYAESVGEALRSRGEPIEVTASDVLRAGLLFVKKRSFLRPMTDLLTRAYVVLGALMTAVGLSYPYLRNFFSQAKLEDRFWAVVVVTGIAMALLGVLARFYFEYLYRLRTRRRLEDISRTTATTSERQLGSRPTGR